MRLKLPGHRDDAAPLRWPTAAIVFAIAVSVATSVLIWVGYVALGEWKQGTTLLLERRRAEMLVMATAALNRDMRGVWTTVLAPLNPTFLEKDPPFEMMRVTATAFARFPYPESFVIARKNGDSELTYVLNRSDRRPPWERDEPVDEALPVVVRRNPAALSEVVATARRGGSTGTFMSFPATIDGQSYLIVSHLITTALPPHEVSTLVAFTVNEAWVRAHYFGPLLEQVARIGQDEPSVILAVRDNRGALVAATGRASQDVPTLGRTFPLLFIDPAAMSLSAVQRLDVEDWTLQVSTPPDNPSVAAQAATLRLLFLMTLAGLVSAIALVMTVRAVRASVRLASMKSDFVAAVTHDLKTPVAVIRLIGDTLANRRYSAAGTVEEYARLLSREAARLSRSIDNLLMYSRYTELSRLPDARRARLNLADLIEDALEPFQPAIAGRDIRLAVEIPERMLPVLGDRQALVQVVETLIDNAIKYSNPHSEVRIVAHATASQVRLEVSDQGIGIPPEDLAHVFERFYRAGNATERGTGLGLTIAQRIVSAHRGAIAIRSTVNLGTTVEVTLPLGANSRATP
jgi:signal transduction histidine kinase